MMNRKKHLRCEVKRLSVHGGCPAAEAMREGRANSAMLPVRHGEPL